MLAHDSYSRLVVGTESAAACYAREAGRKIAKAAGMCAAIGVVSLLSTACLAKEFSVDERAKGLWIKKQVGHVIEIKPNGDVLVTMRGQYRNFSGPGSWERCVEGGGNVCISTEQLGKCSFRYKFRTDGVMNLIKTQGVNVCDELSGDYSRESS
jgi:hypothetical protein